MAIVWPCPLPVDAYVAAGREVVVPRPVCPLCAGPPAFWSGYWRHVRAAGRCRKIFVPRVRCGPCRVSHALLPAFVLAWRLDLAEAVGVVIGQVPGVHAGSGPRPPGPMETGHNQNPTLDTLWRYAAAVGRRSGPDHRSDPCHTPGNGRRARRKRAHPARKR